eukprot:2994683-Pyramimonas_sp.AAC.1
MRLRGGTSNRARDATAERTPPCGAAPASLEERIPTLAASLSPGTPRSGSGIACNDSPRLRPSAEAGLALSCCGCSGIVGTLGMRGNCSGASAFRSAAIRVWKDCSSLTYWQMRARSRAVWGASAGGPSASPATPSAKPATAAGLAGPGGGGTRAGGASGSACGGALDRAFPHAETSAEAGESWPTWPRSRVAGDPDEPPRRRRAGAPLASRRAPLERREAHGREGGSRPGGGRKPGRHGEAAIGRLRGGVPKSRVVAGAEGSVRPVLCGAEAAASGRRVPATSKPFAPAAKASSVAPDNEGADPGRDAGGPPRTPSDQGRSRELEPDTLLARGLAVTRQAPRECKTARALAREAPDASGSLGGRGGAPKQGIAHCQLSLSGSGNPTAASVEQRLCGGGTRAPASRPVRPGGGPTCQTVGPGSASNPGGGWKDNTVEALPGVIAGAGAGVGAGVGAATVTAGARAGVGAGLGAGEGAGAGAGVSAGVGAAAVNAGVRAGVGASAGAEAGVGTGVGAVAVSVGVSAGVGAALGAGRGAG